MEISNIIGAAIGGGLGAALGSLLTLLLPKAWRKTAGIALIVLLSMVGARLAPVALVSLPGFGSNAESQIEEEIKGDPTIAPLFAAWKEADPKAYHEALASLIRDAAGGQSREAMINGMRSKFVAQLASSIPRLDDPHMIEWARITAAEMRELRSTHPQTCVAMLQSKPLGDIRPYLTEPMKAREVKLMTAAMLASKQPVGAALNAQDSQREISAVAAELQTEFSAELALLAPNANTAGHEDRICDLGATMFERMAAKPEPNAAKLLRSLLTAS